MNIEVILQRFQHGICQRHGFASFGGDRFGHVQTE